MENGNRGASPESPAIHRSRSRSHSHQRSRKPRSKSRSRSRSREHRSKKRGSESPRRYQSSGNYGSSFGRGYGASDFRGSRYGGGGYNGSRYGSRPGRYNDFNGHGNIQRETPPEGRCLGVFGLHVETTEKKLRNVFEEFGGLEDIQMVFDAKTGRSRGFAFIYYENITSAKHAKEKLNGIDIDGRKIRVDFSLTQHAHAPTPGMYMGRNGQSRPRSNYYSGGHNSRYNDYPRGGGDYYSRDRDYAPVKRRYSRSRSPRKGYHSYGEEKSSFRRGGHYPSAFEEKYSSSRY